MDDTSWGKVVGLLRIHCLQSNVSKWCQYFQLFIILDFALRTSQNCDALASKKARTSVSEELSAWGSKGVTIDQHHSNNNKLNFYCITGSLGQENKRQSFVVLKISFWGQMRGRINTASMYSFGITLHSFTAS